MKFVGPRYGHVLINGVNYAYVENLGFRWQHLLFPGVGTPAVHFQPAFTGYESSAPSGHLHLMVAMPLGPDDITPSDGGSIESNAPQDSVGGIAQVESAAGLVAERGSEIWHSLSRDDLDPILTALGAAHDGQSDTGARDLSSAFLPQHGDDLPGLGHGLDIGFAFTAPPLPPPVDVI